MTGGVLFLFFFFVFCFHAFHASCFLVVEKEKEKRVLCADGWSVPRSLPIVADSWDRLTEG